MPPAPEPAAGPAYREHAPHPALGRHVECYWTATCRRKPEQRQTGTVLPDGCMDILFSLGDQMPGPGLDEPYVVGTMTRPIDVERAGVVDLVGVRFRPGGAAPFLRMDAAELTDRAAGLHAFWGAAAAEALERLGETSDLARRVGILDDALLTRLRASEGLRDERVLRAAELVAARDGKITVDGLAHASGLGRRQLERRFLAAVGTSPKVAARVARFRTAVANCIASPRYPSHGSRSSAGTPTRRT